MALARASEAGLDLVEISPEADPPVCKILDYGKYKYEEQKKAAEARKHQKVVEIKEIKMRPKHRRSRLRREDARHQALHRGGRQGQGHRALPRPRDGAPGVAAGRSCSACHKADIEPVTKVESEPRMEGRQNGHGAGPALTASPH